MFGCPPRLSAHLTQRKGLCYNARAFVQGGPWPYRWYSPRRAPGGALDAVEVRGRR